MASYDDDSKTLRVLLEEELEEKVDYESNIEFVEPYRFSLVAIIGGNYVESQTHSQNVVRPTC